MDPNNYYPKMEYTPNTSEMQVCHDFQNGHCNRVSCKYLHILRGAAAPYFNPRGFRQYSQPSNVPPCKDFLNGHCRREKCRYRHVNKVELAMENTYRQDSYPRPMMSYGVPEIESTKRHYDDLLYEKSQRVTLLEENIHLRNRVTQLEQQIAELRTRMNNLADQIEHKTVCTNPTVLTTPSVVYQPLLPIITSTPGYPNCYPSYSVKSSETHVSNPLFMCSELGTGYVNEARPLNFSGVESQEVHPSYLSVEIPCGGKRICTGELPRVDTEVGTVFLECPPNHSCIDLSVGHGVICSKLEAAGTRDPSVCVQEEQAGCGIILQESFNGVQVKEEFAGRICEGECNEAELL